MNVQTDELLKKWREDYDPKNMGAMNYTFRLLDQLIAVLITRIERLEEANSDKE